MGVDKRKAFIEFIESDLVCITTPFRQKTFNVIKLNSEGKYINLRSLESFASPKNKILPPFYAIPTLIEDDGRGNKEIKLVVVAKTSEDREKIIGELGAGDEKLFRVSVVEK